MAMKKNLIKSRDEYTRYYGDFRGVDFSSDHTQVHQQRLAYLVNMYKDYRSGEGNSLETIPGFRRAAYVDIDNRDKKINGIHEFNYVEDGVRKSEIVIHAGKFLYLWDIYPLSASILKKYRATPDAKGVIEYPENLTINDIPYIYDAKGSVYYDGYSLETSSRKITFEDFRGQTSSYVTVVYTEGKLKTLGNNTINDSKSVSFQFDNRLYILDGENITVVLREADTTQAYPMGKQRIYVPTTYKDIDVANTTKPISDYEYDQLNALSSVFKHTYIADGKTTKFYLYTPFTSIFEVKAYGESVSDDKYTASPNGYIEFKEAPKAPKDNGEAEGYAGIEITAKYDNTEAKSRILKCKIATVFDKRVFLSGNPDYPNTIYYSADEDPTYFGILNYVTDGVEAAPITAMIPVAETLAVLKSNAKQDGSLYFHTRLETENHIVPVTYPSTRILNGIGCLGAATNFRDDPVFISRMGVEGIAQGIGQFSGKIERAIEHRSSLIDSKLCNLDLTKAQMIEWNGYLIVLCEGCMFMADSRQAYTHESGSMQYEWYYVEGVGFYENQEQEYYFSPILPSEIDKVTIDGVEYKVCLGTDVYDNIRGENVNRLNSPLSLGEYKHVVANNEYVVINNEYKAVLLPSLDEATQTFKNKAYLCEWRGSYTGGTFHPATIITNIDENIYFGTDNGYVGCFNFDKRDEYGTFAPEWYSFDNRTIYSGCATKMDNCDIPHLTKSTIKKSTVIKTRALLSSAAKIKVRTNNKDYEQVARINTRSFTFDTVDFSDFSFVGRDNTIHSVREKEKHWVEKQHFIYTDEYQKPLSLNYIAFRYKISGRVKG
jgi:hypothetical protein